MSNLNVNLNCITEFKSTCPGKVIHSQTTINISLSTWCEMHHKIVLIPSRLIINLLTRMHSSRMRIGRSLTVCWSLLPGGVSGPGGVWSGGVSGPGGVWLGGSGQRGVWSGGISQHALRQTPPVDRHL